jgi:hypothetical protein
MLGSRSDSMGGGGGHSASMGSGDFDAEPHGSHSGGDDQAGPEVSDEDIPF